MISLDEHCEIADLVARLVHGGVRVSAVEPQRRNLEQNARLQNEFFSMVSHEVRSPLAAIRGATALLQTHFETLGLERSHLYRKMKALGITARESAQER